MGVCGAPRMPCDISDLLINHYFLVMSLLRIPHFLMVDGDCPYGSTHNHTAFHAVWMDRACWIKLVKNVGCVFCVGRLMRGSHVLCSPTCLPALCL